MTLTKAERTLRDICSECGLHYTLRWNYSEDIFYASAWGVAERFEARRSASMEAAIGALIAELNASDEAT
jgi:hypothetical protein